MKSGIGLKVKTKSRALAALFAVLLFAVLLFPVQVQAASSSIQDVNITVDLAEDGSALITEQWNISTGDEITEWYLSFDLDNQEIWDLSVSDETGTVYEYLENWDINASLQQKAGKCGIIKKGNTYELCWGIGSYGTHTYTVSYRISNLIKGYDTKDAIGQVFVRMPNNTIDSVTVTMRREGMAFTKEDTLVWGFGHTGEINVTGGEVVSTSTQRLGRGDYVALMVAFEKGMFSPALDTGESFDDFREEGMEGSDYRPDTSPSTTARSVFSVLASSLLPIFLLVFTFSLVKKSSSNSSAHVSRKWNKVVDYSRELPWNGSLHATYARLKDIHALENEGSIVGAYILRWIRSKQVEVVQQEAGFISKKQETALKLYTARPEMAPLERNLYNMLVEAAGPDWVLQSKEFEKWSKRNYSRVEVWMESCKNKGKQDMRAMGGLVTVPTKAFFGLVTTQKEVMSPIGEELTNKMMGFRKYLEDFTIVNEREAREVQLWDEYLVFAQLFGIAEKVAEQFKNIYPDYFHKIETQMGLAYNTYDIIWIMHVSNSFSRSMYRGYHSGHSAANSSYSGGGGGFSGGGGGGFSGSSGGGGR